MGGSPPSQPARQLLTSELDHPGTELDAIIREAREHVRLPNSVEEAYVKSMRCSQQELRIAFYGLGKSGKSTLINALCGWNICPVNDLNETMLTTAILDTPSRRHPYSSAGLIEAPQQGFDEYVTINSVESLPHHQGKDIPTHIHSQNERMRKALQGSTQDRAECITQLKTECTVIEADLASLELDFAREHTRLILLDTPGTNEYNIAQELGELVHRINRFSDIAIYVVNIQAGIADQAIGDIVAGVKAYSHSEDKELQTGFLIAFNHIDGIQNTREVKTRWFRVIEDACTREGVKFEDVKSRICFTSAKILFEYSQVLRYERDNGDMEAKHYLEEEAKRDRQDFATYCQIIKRSAKKIEEDSEIKRVLRAECRRVLVSKKKHFAIYAQQTARCMRELLREYADSAARTDVLTDAKNQHALNSLRGLKHRLFPIQEEIKRLALRFDERRNATCIQIQREINQIRGKVDNQAFSYDDIASNIYQDFDQEIQEAITIVTPKIKEIKKLLRQCNDFRLTENSHLNLQSWTEHVCYTKSKPWTRSEKVVVAGGIGLGVGALAGAGLALLLAVCPPCGVVATPIVVGAAVGAAVGSGGEAIGAAIATSKTNREHNEIIIKSLQVDKGAIERTSIQSSSVGNLMQLIDISINLSEERIARDIAPLRQLIVRCDEFLEGQPR